MAMKQLALAGIVAAALAQPAGAALATPGSGTTGVVVARAGLADRVTTSISRPWCWAT